jgi:hypothetical protein
VWFFRGGLRWSLFSVQSNPLFEFRLPLESHPVRPSRQAAARPLLSWALVPYSTFRIEGPLAAGLPARGVPPSGFGYPLDGLRPLIPRRVCFAPAALVGFTLRSFPLSKGIRGVSAGMSPPAVFPVGDPAAEATGRPQQAAASGIQPFRESLAAGRSVSQPATGCSPGFRPSRVLHQDLGQDFARPPLTRFAARGDARSAGVPECRSVLGWPGPESRTGVRARTGRPS